MRHACLHAGIRPQVRGWSGVASPVPGRRQSRDAQLNKFMSRVACQLDCQQKLLLERATQQGHVARRLST